jgi:hypothetical protein
MSSEGRNFKNIKSRAVIKFFFFERQEAEGNSGNSDRNVKGYIPHGKPPSKTGWPNLNVVIFPHVLRQVWDEPNNVHTGVYCSISRTNFGRPPDFGQINSRATGHLSWMCWVNHAWRFGQAEALREVGPEMSERVSKTSTVPVDWQIWKFSLGAIQMISCRSRLVTVDESWLYHYDPEIKQHSMEWRHSGSPHPK